jgi:hypothetical protein
MTHLEAVRAALIANSALTGLVGQKVYPAVAPQGVVAPFVVITTISSVPQNSMTGGPANRLRIARVQIDSYAPTYLQAHQVADAVDAVVADLSAEDLSAAQESSADLYDDQTQLRRVSTDYLVAM